jgi:hypothetical protein
VWRARRWRSAPESLSSVAHHRLLQPPFQGKDQALPGSRSRRPAKRFRAGPAGPRVLGGRPGRRDSMFLRAAPRLGSLHRVRLPARSPSSEMLPAALRRQQQGAADPAGCRAGPLPATYPPGRAYLVPSGPGATRGVPIGNTCGGERPLEGTMERMQAVGGARGVLASYGSSLSGGGRPERVRRPAGGPATKGSRGSVEW